MRYTSLMSCCSDRPVEIAEEVEEDQCFLFGHLTPDVDHVRYLNQYEAMPLNERCAELAKVSDLHDEIRPDDLMRLFSLHSIGLRCHQGRHVRKWRRRYLLCFAVHR